jgi:hypothetical protein
LPANWPSQFSQKGLLGPGQLAGVNLKGLVGIENNFNSTTFYPHFCVKTGVKCPKDFFWYSLSPETYSEKKP